MTGPITAPLGPDQRAWASLKARAEAAGHSCSRDERGWITLTRWGRSASFESLGAASDWLDHVIGGGASK